MTTEQGVGFPQIGRNSGKDFPRNEMSQKFWKIREQLQKKSSFWDSYFSGVA